MIYAPHELRATALRDVPAGTVFSFSNTADDFPCVIKLASDDESSNWIMPLAGEYAFHVIPWSDESEVTTTLCRPDSLRFRLGDASWQQHHNIPGVLTLHPDGAFIATIRQGHSRAPKVSVASWDFVKAANLEAGCAKYPKWELGYVNAKHDFTTILSH